MTSSLEGLYRSAMTKISSRLTSLPPAGSLVVGATMAGVFLGVFFGGTGWFVAAGIFIGSLAEGALASRRPSSELRFTRPAKPQDYLVAVAVFAVSLLCCTVGLVIVLDRPALFLPPALVFSACLGFAGYLFSRDRG